MKQEFEQVNSVLDNNEKSDLNYEQELTKAEDKLRILAQIVGADFNMKVKFGELNQGSFFDAINNTITLDPIFIKENKYYFAEFVAGHEGGHRAITRHLEQIGISHEKANKLYQKIGFSYLDNCIEDCADNSWVSNVFSKFKNSSDAVYREQFERDNVSMTTPEINNYIAMLGYTPKFVSYGSEIIRKWATGGYSNNLDKDVLETINKTEKYFQSAYEEIPGEYSSERQRIKSATGRFRIIYENILSEFQKLVDLDIDKEKLRELAQQMIKNAKNTDRGQDNSQSGSGNMPKELQDELEKLSQENKKELLDQIEEQIKDLEKKIEDMDNSDLSKNEKENYDNQNNDEDNSKENKKTKVENGESDSDSSNNESDKDDNQENELTNRNRKNNELEEQLKKLQSQKQSVENGDKNIIPFDKLSENAKKELQEIFDKLSEDEKKKLDGRAKETLEEFDDKLIEETRSKFDEQNIPKTHEELKRELANKDNEQKQDVNDEEKLKKQFKESEKVQKKIEQQIENNLSEYDKIYKEISHLVDEFYNRIHQIFLPQRHPKWQKGHPDGHRLDLNKVMQFKADKTLYDKIWERKTIPKTIDYKFLLLVDLSGSMRGNKIRQTFMGVMLVSEVLNRLGIKFEINGFNDYLYNFKNFRDNLSPEIREKMLKMFNVGNNTQMGYAMTEVSKTLEKNKGKDNFLISFTDGNPTDNAKEYQLDKVIEKIRKNTKQKLVGIGLGSGTEHVANYYPTSLPNTKIEDLPKLLGNLLEDMIKNPFKYN